MKMPSNAQPEVIGYQTLPGGKLIGMFTTRRVIGPSVKVAPALGPADGLVSKMVGVPGVIAKIW